MSARKIWPQGYVEYDFVLEYNGRESPYRIGDEVTSPVKDSRTTHFFEGFAFVTAEERSWIGGGSTVTQYVQQAVPSFVRDSL